MPSSTTARKKAAAPRPAAKRAARAEPSERPAPLVDLTRDAFDESAVGRIFLFKLAGTNYYIPDDAPASTLQQYAEIETTKGARAAMWWLFREWLGNDGADALLNYKRLTKDHLSALHTACLNVLTGPKA
jgi:hypothetical protein